MEPLSKPTVFIIDEDPAFKSSLSWQLESTGFVTKTFSFLETFFTFYREDIPGCLIIDIASTGGLGVELIGNLRKKNIFLSIIFLSDKPELHVAVKAIKLGAQDFLYKTTSLTLLSQSIQQALYHNHHHRLFEVNSYHANSLYAHLSLREKEVLYYVLEGYTNKIIAEKLDLTVKTIEAHRANIMKKMQVDSLSELVTLAVKYNVIKKDELCFFE